MPSDSDGPAIDISLTEYYDRAAREAISSGHAERLGTVTTQSHVVKLRDAIERNHLRRILPLRSTDRVLDLGGGAGRIAFELAPHVAEVVLVDASSVQIEAARKRAEQDGHHNVQCVVDSILSPRPEGPFDIVIVFGVLAHLSDEELTQAAELLPSLLKPGGRLVVKEPVSTDGIPRDDIRRDEAGNVQYHTRFRPRETYPRVLAGHLSLSYQSPTCAHLIPASLEGTQHAAEASDTPLVRTLIERLTPLWVQLDPLLQSAERAIRSSPASPLLADVPVLQDLYLFERRGSKQRVEQPDLSVAVIAYNEEECITQVTWELIGALDAAGLAFEIILVDDGSSDGTRSRMAEIANIDPRVRLSPNPKNLGIGGALRNGFDAASGTYVTWIPGDGQIPPESLITLFQRRHEAEMLTTVYRSRADGWYRNTISSTLNRLIFLKTGKTAKSGGNYLFRKATWVQHAPRDDDSMMISTAFRGNLHAAGIPIVEVAIDARARVAGHSKVLNPGTILRTLFATLRMK